MRFRVPAAAILCLGLITSAHGEDKITLRFGEIANSARGVSAAAINIAQLRFLYGEASVDLEDERQFARNPGAGVSSLVLPAISGCSR